MSSLQYALSHPRKGKVQCAPFNGFFIVVCVLLAQLAVPVEAGGDEGVCVHGRSQPQRVPGAARDRAQPPRCPHEHG